ncbi:MAG: alpha/beta hydrolase [Paracoccaceae bacterium]
MSTDWDDAYAIGDHIPDADAYIEKWPVLAAAFRERLAEEERLHENLAYGTNTREKFDLFLPEGTPAGILVFVHGGYWRAFDKSFWSHLARGGLQRGWAVAMPSYVLCPKYRIADITRRVARAIERIAERVDGPVRLSGHSAGGHLVARMACGERLLSRPVCERVEKILSISGVHDLRPLLRTRMNADLRLDLIEAEMESPALLTPREEVRLICWAGGAERPEFIRQTILLANAWTGSAAETDAVIEPDKHHFNVIDGLLDPHTEMCEALFG